jgi:hypothetical protein
MDDNQLQAIVDASHRMAEAADRICGAATQLLEAMVAAEGRTVQKLAAEVRKVNEARELLHEYNQVRQDEVPQPGGRTIPVGGGRRRQLVQLPPDKVDG